MLKFLQVMTEKGLVQRDDAQRTHIYRTTVSEEETQRQLAEDLLERAFNGSTKNLVLQALSSRKTSEKDLPEIRRLLDEIEEGRKS